MAHRVELAFRRAVEPLIAPGSSILLAVSGGSDSMALLDLLVRWSNRRRLSLTVAHLDHGLRRGSRADRRFVERAARLLDLPIRAERREVGALRRRDESPEEAARRVRRGFLIETAKDTGCESIATGHTADDQAETILMRLVRGAGTKALTGMATAGPGPFVRPLLALERDDLRNYLTRRGLEYREDLTNRDTQFDRNRIRQRVLPYLSRQLNPRAARHLVQAADRLREDALFLDALAEQEFDRIATNDRAGRLTLDAAGLAAEPAPIAKRLAHLALARAGADPRRIVSRHVDALLDLAGGAGGRSIDLPGRLRARRARRRLILES